MRPILNRTNLFFVILLSSLVVTGCSSDPRLEADRAVERANEEIAAHDELFDEARNNYSEAQQSIRENAGNQDSENQDGDGADSEGTQAESAEAQRISEARDALEEARGRLQDAREEISSIQDLDVSGELLDYSRALDEALAAQIRAEEREIAFYEVLAEDPTLEENRDRAMELLDEARSAYAEAESGYEEANEIADSNPELVAPEGGGSPEG